MPDEDRRPRDRNEFNPGRELRDLSEREQEEIGKESRPDALLIHETIRAEGESQLKRDSSALLISGLAAGLSMGFSLVVEGLLHEKLPSAPWRDLVSSLGYTIGFLIVVLGRQQLFTENTLTPILPLLHNRDGGTLGKVLRLWTLVLVANIAASWVFAVVIAHTSVFEEAAKTAFSEVSRTALASPPFTTFLKAIFAGWLIALMVWLLPAVSGAGRPLVIVIITYVVSLGDFSHIIAGAVDVFYLLETGEARWAEAVSGFFLPTLLGNVVGGVALVAILNYGQVAKETGRR
ncbi:MAG: formate/nitrite transporter family protein [Pseudomonadota bacterium]|nr:formate/nitrite transporter family protein [Pseudomonadota bacterium]